MTAILAYHDLDSRPGPGITHVSPAMFERQIDFLLERGWRAVTFDRVRESPSADRLFAITFDDAFTEQLQHALPVLQRRRVPAHVFVVTAFVGRTARWDYRGRRRWHADWDLLRRWVAAGMTAGSHAHSHRDLRRLDDAELAFELARSRALLADRLQCGVDTLSYPFGRHDARVVTAAGRAGYRLAVTVDPRLSQTDRLRLPRVVVSRLDTELSLYHRLRPTLWGGLERTKQRIISAWAGGTIRYQALREMAA